METPRDILRKIRHVELKTRGLVAASFAGHYRSVFKGRGMNFEEVREYAPGDEVRTIDWNVTARIGEMHGNAFVKKFTEERELTVMLLVDVSASGRFGGIDLSKRELAAEIASVLAFSAIRNNDKVGLLLYTDEVEKYIPPRKGRGHVLRVIREVLFYEPRRRGTNLVQALEFMGRVLPHKAICTVISDFLTSDPAALPPAGRAGESAGPLPRATQTALRMANRRHDVVAVHVADHYELQLPALGRLVFEDAETGEVIELNTGNATSRAAFALRQEKNQEALARQLRGAGVDTIQLRTDQPYGAALGRFFENREKRRLRG